MLCALAGGPRLAAIITFEDFQGATRYIARALHNDNADRLQHEEMAFRHGWNAALDLFVGLVKTMKAGSR
jgi:uncharacterized protein YndB with AHSA1/START domain